MPRIDIIDALELILESTSDKTRQIIRLAISEIDRLRTVEVAALELVDLITQPGNVALPTEKHPLVEAIRGKWPQRT